MIPSSTTKPAGPTAIAVSDAELIGQSEAVPDLFGEVFVRHARFVFAFAAVRVGPQAAEDVTAEVFATAFRRRSSFDSSAGSARPWLYGIAVHKLRNFRDAETLWFERGARMPAESAEAHEDDADERVDAARRVPVLVEALDGLGAAERDALLVSVLCDYGPTEVASVLGIRVGAAKVRLSRGRASMRAALERLGMTGIEDDHG